MVRSIDDGGRASRSGGGWRAALASTLLAGVFVLGGPGCDEPHMPAGPLTPLPGLTDAGQDADAAPSVDAPVSMTPDGAGGDAAFDADGPDATDAPSAAD